MIGIILGIIGWLWNLLKEHWLTIVLVFVGLSVLGHTLGALDRVAGTAKYKMIQARYNSMKNSDVSKALEYLTNAYESERLLWSDYEKELIDLAGRRGMKEAMQTLRECYLKHAIEAKENASSAKDEHTKRTELSNMSRYEAKAAQWMKQAAATGDIECIRTYYGFSDYEVNSKFYDEILQALEKAEPVSDVDIRTITYMRGIVYYRKGDIDSAKQAFAPYMDLDESGKSMYMLARCFFVEQNIAEAESIMRKLEDRGFRLPAAEYKQLYSYYSGIDGATSDMNKAHMYALRYMASEESDISEVADMLIESCLNLANAYDQGSYGFEKDMKKACQYYDNAAFFGDSLQIKSQALSEKKSVEISEKKKGQSKQDGRWIQMPPTHQGFRAGNEGKGVV